MDKQQLSHILRRVSIYIGVAILFISMFLSFDGFDGSVSGGNPAYSAIGVIIGVVFALAVSVLQFVFASNVAGLNKTLVFAGLFSYFYSIYTNKMGAGHLLGMSDSMAWTTAVFADIVAEPMIAWGMGEALVGDFIGNILKVAFGAKQEERPAPRYTQRNSEVFNRLPKKDVNPFFQKK